MATALRWSELRHLQLAIFFFAYMLAMPWLETTWVLRVLTLAVLMNAFLVSASERKPHPLVNHAAWFAFTVAVAASILEQFGLGSALLQTTAGYLIHIGGMAVALLCAGNILTLVFSAQRVTADSVFASLVVYQLVGLFFAEAYTLVEMVHPGSFHFPNTGAVPAGSEHVELLYFSFVTVATLGYGDILPLTSFARGVVVIEAIAGQFYVAVVVAILVGAFFADAFTARRHAGSSKHVLASDVAAHTTRQTTRRVVTRRVHEPATPRKNPRR
jgi:ion channel